MTDTLIVRRKFLVRHEPSREDYSMLPPSDPLLNATYHGIKRGIETCLGGECHGAALVLIYAGIDTMASLARPPDGAEVHPSDFIGWCERYLELDGETEITGEEWYSARCAVLHGYGTESRRTRAGTARQLGYMVGGGPPVRFNAEVSEEFVLVDIPALAQAFFTGLDAFLPDLLTGDLPTEVIEDRTRQLLNEIPYAQAGDGG